MGDEDAIQLRVIARMRSDFSNKFGVPRQSGLVEELSGRIVFESEFRNPDAVRGLEGFSHIWLIWGFSRNHRPGWSATVRPPRLGGNTRLGVFATRSSFRPNPIGISCVRLEKVEIQDDKAPVLVVRGADLMDGTPIYDIKPYLPYADCHPEAGGGFTEPLAERKLQVCFPGDLLSKFPEDKQKAILGVLEQDPRPSYQEDGERIYGMSFAGRNVRFSVADGVLTVREVEKEQGERA